MKLSSKARLLLLGGLMAGSAPAMAAPDIPYKMGCNIDLTIVEPKGETLESFTFSGWNGQWVEESEYVRLFGVSSNLVTSENSAVFVPTLSRNFLQKYFLYLQAPLQSSPHR